MTDERCKILLKILFDGELRDVNLLTCTREELTECMNHIVGCYFEYFKVLDNHSLEVMSLNDNR